MCFKYKEKCWKSHPVSAIGVKVGMGDCGIDAEKAGVFVSAVCVDQIDKRRIGLVNSNFFWRFLEKRPFMDSITFSEFPKVES